MNYKLKISRSVISFIFVAITFFQVGVVLSFLKATTSEVCAAGLSDLSSYCDSESDFTQGSYVCFQNGWYKCADPTGKGNFADGRWSATSSCNPNADPAFKQDCNIWMNDGAPRSDGSVSCKVNPDYVLTDEDKQLTVTSGSNPENIKILGGTNCVQNYGKCDAGMQNLFQNLGGSINLPSTEVTSTTIRELSKAPTGGDTAIQNAFCVRSTINAYVFNDVLSTAVSSGNVIGCIGANKPSKGISLTSHRTSWGCCPSGYKYAVDNSQAVNASMACCKDVGTENVVYKNGVCTDFLTGSAVLDTSSSQARPTLILYTESSFAYEGFGVTDMGKVDKLFACPSDMQIGCALANKGASVTSPSAIKDECYKCFAVSEPISANVKTKKLLVCEGDGKATSYDFINGTINDTLAYVAALNGSGAENANQLKSCRENGGIYIAIGCVDPTPLGILTGLIRIAFGIMGGVALAQLIYAGIMYQSGDETKIAEARSKVVSTIAGIAVLVFSVLILRIIGVNILDTIPVGAI